MTQVVVIYGTRPEIIKLGPLVRMLGNSVHLVNTGQHFDRELSDSIATEYGLPEPAVSLEIGGDTRAKQISRGLAGVESELYDADAVVVQGDTNSALAGALGANALEVPLFHVEAGLRSFDRRMPEEHNRVLIDHLADMCWAPTDGNVENLKSEGIPVSRTLKSGNSIVEAMRGFVLNDSTVVEVITNRGLISRKYILATLHRPENVDNGVRLAIVLELFGRLGMPVIFPMHPRTTATLVRHSIHVPPSVQVVEPVGHREFLALMAASALTISDSGGVQEEVSVLKIPLIVLRRSTERPEVVGTFASITSDPEEMFRLAERVLGNVDATIAELQTYPTPFGDGRASIRMRDSLSEFLGVQL